ncbi:MAG: glycoside hydrolase family 2 protein [Fidelibacterota bacterium]|nr:MAG: glycoside hydrolase family 2 protein [Candidatus Neomarinimicrobiota bacterium]
MKRRVIIRTGQLSALTLGVLIFLSCDSGVQQNGLRSIQKLNTGWRFHKGDVEGGYKRDLEHRKWARIDLPHTWNVDDPFDQRGVDDGYDIAPGYYRGPAWYRKMVRLPRSREPQRYFLEFEGANKVADVWVNEVHVGNHTGGYTGFRFDITPHVNLGKDNLIAVRVNNAYHYDIPPQSADYTMYGGIYRDVYLVRTAPVYFDHAHVMTPKVSREQAIVILDTRITNASGASFAGRVEAIVHDPHGKEVASSSTEISFPSDTTAKLQVQLDGLDHPLLWSPEKPQLYTAKVQIISGDEVIDSLSERFGLRWFSFDPDHGFFLNGEHLRLKGVNRHQDRAGYGNAVPNELHVYDMQLIKAMGANFVRLAHYPQDPAVLDACDRLGLLVWEEIPVVRSVGREAFKANAVQMLAEMIDQHINHPSIIIWGVMNEVVRDQPDDELHWSVELCQELVDLAHALDPSRYTAQAQFQDRGTNIMGITEISGWNCYDGWYRGVFEEFGANMDERKQLYPQQVFIISEYGAGSKRGFHIENPTFPDFSEEWQLAFHRSYWEQISQRPYIAGSCVWNMFDFGSYEKGGNIPHINQKGLADFDRQPKDVYYFYQSIWTEEPMVHIVSHTWTDRMGIAGEKKGIQVFSNCDSVEFFVNGSSLGFQERPFTWEVSFRAGVNRLEAVGYKAGVTLQDELTIRYTHSVQP